jgi:hypothetical protein
LLGGHLDRDDDDIEGIGNDQDVNVDDKMTKKKCER